MSAVYEQQREAIATNAVATIAKSIKEQYAPFFKHHSADPFKGRIIQAQAIALRD